MKFRKILLLTGLAWGAVTLHPSLAAAPSVGSHPKTVGPVTSPTGPTAPPAGPTAPPAGPTTPPAGPTTPPAGTPAQPDGPATLSATMSDIPQTVGVQLNWAPVARAQYYNIYRDDVHIAGIQPVLTFLDQGAEPRKVHTYKVRAYADNQDGKFSGVVSVNFTPTTVAPINLTAQPSWAECCSTTGMPMPHVILNWNSVDNSVSYSVYRNGTLLKDAIAGVSYIDMTAVSGKTYSYTVRNNGRYGTSKDSKAAVAKAPSRPLTTPGDGNALLPPTNLVVKNIWVGLPTDALAWSPVTGALAYNIYQYGDLIAAGVSGTNYQVATNLYSRGLTYSVTSVDAMGMESIPSSLSYALGSLAPGAPPIFTPEATVVPYNVTGKSEWNNGRPRVSLTWCGEYGDRLYDVYRNGVEVASGLWTLAYFDDNVVAGRTYRYQVSANDASTNLSVDTSLSAPVAVTAAPDTLPSTPGIVSIGAVKADDDSALVSFQAVPGAVDYRIYSTANRGSMKYSGGGLSIEMNGITPGAGADLIVEAVDKLGPFQTMDGAMGPGAMAMNGMTNISINGQGDPSNLPRVIARSPVFHVTPNPTVLTGTQVFFDNFRNAKPLVQATAIDPVIAAANFNGPTDATNPFVQEFANDKWTIRDYDGDMSYTRMFFMGNHFMDTLFDGGTAHKTGGLHNNNATLVLMPKATVDISGGRVMHVTFEVDAHFDGRRWCDVVVAPAGDPLIHPGKLDGGLWATASGNLFRWEIRAETHTAQEFLAGQMTNLIDTNAATGVAGNGIVRRIASNGGVNFNGSPQDLDKRHKFDLYLSRTHYRLVENGVLVKDADLASPLPFSVAQPYFLHEVYHTGNDRNEQVNMRNDPYYYNCRPWSDERHWDNMGFEVLAKFPS